MKVLVADRLPQAATDRLLADGFDVALRPELTADALGAHLSGVEVLIVRSTVVAADALDAGESLRLVIRAGAGVSNIDLRHASDHGIFVANCPGKNAVAVAELTIGLLLSTDRRIPAANSQLAAGRWNKKEFAQARGIQGRTLGLAGFGAIGRAVARRARALGMKVLAWDRSIGPQDTDELGVTHVDSLPALAEACDVLSVHLPLTDETRGVISADIIALLGADGTLINTSRGGIVDESAVADALDGGLRYGTDVFEGEPGASVADFSTPLATHPNVVCTPHIGASTAQAQQAVADEALRILRAFADRGDVPNCVNLCEPRGGWSLVVRHYNRVGVLAAVLGLLRGAHINVEELENLIFTGEVAACARITLSGAPSDDVTTAIANHPDVIGVTLRSS